MATRNARATRGSFKPSRSLAADLRNDRQFRQFLHDLAEQAAAEARKLAKTEAYDAGDYHDSIHVEETTFGPRVVADDHKAVWIEFGTGEPAPTKSRGILRRGARKAGLRFGKKRRKRALI